MPKARLKKWLPKPDELKNNKAIALFAPSLADARLWQLNRKSLVRATYIGVMCAFLPLPGQMPLAIALALLFRANVPMSVALTWLTNPATSLPIYWATYWVGAKLLGEPPISIQTIGRVIADTTRWIFSDGVNPFLVHKFFSFKAFGVGLVISAIICSIILGLALDFFWQWRVNKNWKKRQGYNPNAPRLTRTKKSRSSHSR